MKKILSKKAKKWICIILCLCLVLASIPFILNLIVINSAKKYILTEEDAAGLNTDCVLVLGAKVLSDDVLSHMLEDRMSYGVAMYNSGAGKKLLLSGDHGRDGYDEVNAMKLYALDKGIETDDVFMDHAGFSTYESMYRARDVFEVKSVVIITQKYHLYRAIYIARSLGLEAYGVASDPRRYGTEAYNNIREFLARVKDFGKCIIEPEPTYLGEVIPISGSGTATDDRD